MIRFKSKCVFIPPKCCQRRRNNRISQIVLHWTGGTGNANRVFKTLSNRGFSYHYLVDADGIITQFVPCVLKAYHAGKANENSIGVALVGKGVEKEKSSKIYATEQKINGVPYLIREYTLPQKASLFWLLDTLSDLFLIPRRTLTSPRTLDPEKSRTFEGVLGHFHISDRKLDPGVKILQELGDFWYGDCTNR